MTATPKELLEGIVLTKISEELSTVKDPIDILSEEKLVEMKEREFHRHIHKDANVLTQVDKYGDLPETNSAIANYQDRTYLEDFYGMPEPYKIGFEIPRQDLDLFGVTKEKLNSTKESMTDAEVKAFGQKIMDEYNELFKGKIRDFRRLQCRNALINMGRVTAIETDITDAGYNKPVFPLGLPVVALKTARTTAWNFTNIGDSALDADSYSEAVNLFHNGQVNVQNREVGLSKAIWLLHANDVTIAEKITMPQAVNETQMRTVGGTFIPVSAKSVGVYGDRTNTSDWILLGENHKIYRKYRKDAGTAFNNGLSIRMYVREDNGALRIEVYTHSMMVIDSPVDIFKAVVTV